MPNHVVNHISLQGDPEKIRSMLETIKSDEHGIGSVDFNKIVPMSKSLDIEAGSRTDRGLKAYRDFIDVYTLAGTMNMEKLRNIPVESEEIFLRQRTDIRRDEWELGKAAWRNIRDFGAPTWYDWCISNWGTKWNAYGYSEDTIDYHDGDTLYFQTAWSAPHPILEKLTQMFPDIKVDEAIAKAEALNKDDYKDFSGVEAAINAVVRGKDITEQDKVDAMAKAIEDAIANLEHVSSTSPETGDNSNMAIWFVLLFVSGAALFGATAYGRKKKYSK